MPRRDEIHDPVRIALENDGWKITADPLVIQFDDLKLFTDLAAERTLAAERNDRKIAVEIKSFLGNSPIVEFQRALGQYEMYREFLNVTDPGRELFLAVGLDVYVDHFERSSIQYLIDRLNISLFVVDTQKEEIQKWIN